jgi:hypothetical protein
MHYNLGTINIIGQFLVLFPCLFYNLTSVNPLPNPRTEMIIVLHLLPFLPNFFMKPLSNVATILSFVFSLAFFWGGAGQGEQGFAHGKVGTLPT